MPLDWILRPDVLGLGMGLVALVVAAIGLWRAGELSHRIKRQAHEIQALQQRLDQRTPPTQA
ncbi:MAG: hypothetical protein KGY81_08705, partial [Phycisphaerae bacterium]|nr:hypothetical protein [Phycisphaerae bacterium]